MKNTLLLLGLILCCALGAVAVRAYQSANTGRLLAEEFFDARPASGYGTRRVLTPGVATDAGASILRQGIQYHQQAEYDLALVSFRAYFSDHPVIGDPQPAILAATAAMASGAYGEVETFLAELPPHNPTRLWLAALLELRQENLLEAKKLLFRLENTADNPYPVSILISQLP